MKERKQNVNSRFAHGDSTTEKSTTRRGRKSNPQGTVFDFSEISVKTENVPKKKIGNKNKEQVLQDWENSVKSKRLTMPKGRTQKKKKPVKIIFLGGVGEIGKNMTAI